MTEFQAPLELFSEPEPSGLRLVATLTLAGLISGLILVATQQITAPMIAANEARALQQAVFTVLPGTESMTRMVWTGSELVPSTDNPNDDDAPSVYAGFDGQGQFTGFAIPGEGAGFQDIIQVLYGYDPLHKQIVGFHVLNSKETPGLGDKIYKDDAFQENFRALSVEPRIRPVAHGSKTNPNEVDCITGATISSKAVVKILNAANESWLQRLPTTVQPPNQEGR